MPGFGHEGQNSVSFRYDGFVLRLAATLVGMALSVVVPSGVARACSAPGCAHAYLLPDQGTLPVNAPGLVWAIVRGPEVAPDGFQLFAPSGMEVPVELEWIEDGPQEEAWVRVIPLQPLAPNADYHAQATSPCIGGMDIDATVRTSAAAPLPTSVGALTAGPARREPLDVGASGSCSARIDAVTLSVEVELSDDARPWRGLLLWTTEVDGTPWRPKHSITDNLPTGGSWAGRGRDLLFTRCEETGGGFPTIFPSLSEGRHTVQMFARLSGTDVRLATNRLEVELSCSTSGRDAGAMDASPEDVAADAGAGPGAGGRLELDEESCGCVVMPHSGRSPWSLLALLSLVFVRARLTRRPKPRSPLHP